MATKKAAKKTKKASAKSTGDAKSKSSPKAASKSASKSESGDLINMILADHKPLKSLIKVLKDSEKYEIDERREAFEEFTPLLVSHAKPEEQTMYVFMKSDEDLREGGFEGDVEHQLADQLVEEAKRTDDEDLWSARVKVLAELVEHHIEEEEEEMLPHLRKNSEREQRVQLGEQYMQLKTELEAKGGDDAPAEALIKERQNKLNKHSKSPARSTIQ